MSAGILFFLASLVLDLLREFAIFGLGVFGFFGFGFRLGFCCFCWSWLLVFIGVFGLFGFGLDSCGFWTSCRTLSGTFS